MIMIDSKSPGIAGDLMDPDESTLDHQIQAATANLVKYNKANKTV